MRMTTLMLTNRHLRDLNPILAGAENCEPGHAFGPAVRNYTLLHYVASGRGVGLSVRPRSLFFRLRNVSW